MVNPFKARTVSTAADLTADERLYLANKTKELKQAYLKDDEKVLKKFRIDDPNLGIYLCFFEPSTRTKESFRNAAQFHRIQLNDLDVGHSSFKKHESYYNTFKTLFGYDNNIFIVRSKTEGLCTWLKDKVSDFASRNSLKKPAFINGGDGKHEHPTQEELDQFTFLEQLNWKNDKIHIALIGDLYHGRTVHSKVDGLSRFKKVKVDLIAPKLLQMPNSYILEMKHRGYEVNMYDSLDEYYAKKDIATIQYFTRLQLERMGESILNKEKQLRASVTFRKDFIELMPKGTKLYHPQPFDKLNPTIPGFIEPTSLNGYDTQSMNGYFFRIILLAAVAGKVGDDFKGKAYKEPVFKDDFVKKVAPKVSNKESLAENGEGLRPIKDGVVIDHICKEDKVEDIWKHLNLIRYILKIKDPGYCGVFESKKNKRIFKGLMFLPRHPKIDEDDIKRLGAVAPGCTLNFVKNHKVTDKFRLGMPPRIYGFSTLTCKNENCITGEGGFEGIFPVFYGEGHKTFRCKYCDTVHTFKEIWIKE